MVGRSLLSVFVRLPWMILVACCTTSVAAFIPNQNNPFISRTCSKPAPQSQCPAPSNYFGAFQKQHQHLHCDRMTSSTLLQAVSINTAALKRSTWLVRIVFLRALAFVYSVAFWIAYQQNKALIGDNGITPARRVLDEAETRGQATRIRRDEWLSQPYNNNTSTRKNPIKSIGNYINRQSWYKNVRELFWDRADRLGRPVTTWLWLAPDRSNLNPWLDGIALTGFGLALSMLWLGSANVPLLLTLWTLQRSLMAVGGPWYGYGWEPQLAELGFHALFMVPRLSLDAFVFATPTITIWAMRWFLFRIMLGAGLIKLKPKADKKWKNLTAMDCFYETQPVPNPLTRYFHWAPQWWHKFEVLSNHFVEVVAPWLLILPGLPRSWRIAGGVIQLVFQSILIASGNLSFLNWLTMVPALWCFDDAFVQGLFSSGKRAAAIAATAQCGGGNWVRRVVTVVFGALIGTLSIPVVRNLCAKRQIMNSSFDPLRLVNTYGAFGSVNEERYELVISSASNVAGPWKEYEFKVKPGDVMRNPRWISPYHYRLDWQMWIACTCQAMERSPWMYSFLLCLLEQNPEVLNLLENDPWATANNTETSRSNDDEGSQRPTYIRIDRYRYKFHKPLKDDENLKEGKKPYWDREYVGRFFPRQGVASITGLRDFVRR